MSLEESMIALAESNEKLAAAQTRLAEAQEKVADKYDEMIAFVAANGGEVKTPAKTKAKEEPADDAPKKRGRPTAAEAKAKAAAKAKEDDDDGFGDEEEEETGDETYTFDQVKAKLKEVRDAYGDKEPALELIGEYGYKAIPEIKEKDYTEIYNKAEKLIAKAK